MKLTSTQRKLIDKAYLEAKELQDELYEKIDNLETELASLNAKVKLARSVECNAINMLNGVEPFDKQKLELK